nr:arrestin domain-containing protein 5 [Helicoverpa armigera]
MTPKCQIILNRTREGHFKAGQYVTGIVKFSIYKPKRYDSIDISFEGRGKCVWTQTDSPDDTIYINNKEEVVSINKNLFTPVGDEMVEPGDYAYPFEFLLPDDIPSSVKTDFGRIHYKIFVKFEKKRTFGAEVKLENEREVPVYGFVEPLTRGPAPFKVEHKLRSFNANNKITVKGVIDRTFLRPGDSIRLKMTVTNDSNVAISIKSQLVHQNTYTSKEKYNATYVSERSIPGTKETSPPIRANSVTKLERTIPVLDTLYSIQNSKILEGEFEVKVTIKAPFPYGKEYARVPVVIGWTKEEYAALIQRELPPSYSEAISGNN